MSKQLLIAIFGLLLAKIVSASECSEMINELKAMKQAQQSVISSLVSDNEVYAGTMESYSVALKDTAGRAHKVVTTNMDQSAKSIRARGLKTQKIAQKLNSATDDLIQRLAKCL